VHRDYSERKEDQQGNAPKNNGFSKKCNRMVVLRTLLRILGTGRTYGLVPDVPLLAPRKT
jgi:hypothetical protein